MGSRRLLAARGDDVTASVRSEEAREQLQDDVARHRARFAIVTLRHARRGGDPRRGEASSRSRSTCSSATPAPMGRSANRRWTWIFPARSISSTSTRSGRCGSFRPFCRPLRRAENPRIVLMSSGLGSMATAGSTNIAYRAAKAALNKIAQGLAHDLKRERVIVVALNPGWVRTDMGGKNADLSVEESAQRHRRDDRRADAADTGRFVDYRGRDVLVSALVNFARASLTAAAARRHRRRPSPYRPSARRAAAADRRELSRVRGSTTAKGARRRRSPPCRPPRPRRSPPGRAARRRRSDVSASVWPAASRAPIERTTSGDCANVPWPSGSMISQSVRSTT